MYIGKLEVALGAPEHQQRSTESEGRESNKIFYELGISSVSATDGCSDNDRDKNAPDFSLLAFSLLGSKMAHQEGWKNI